MCEHRATQSDTCLYYSPKQEKSQNQQQQQHCSINAGILELLVSSHSNILLLLTVFCANEHWENVLTIIMPPDVHAYIHQRQGIKKKQPPPRSFIAKAVFGIQKITVVPVFKSWLLVRDILSFTTFKM